MSPIWIVLLTFALLQKVDSVIYRLNVTEYNRMPSVYGLDDYKQCLEHPEGLYCNLKLELVSEERNALLDMIREYSEDTAKHFNHSILERGTCVTRTCKQFYNNRTDVKLTLERCYNASLWRDYGLRARVTDGFTCDTHFTYSSIGNNVTKAQIFVAALFFCLITLNILGTFYDLCSNTNGNQGLNMLLCFSIRRNWNKLITPPTHADPRLERFSSFYGFKCFLTVSILLAHISVSNFIYISNTQYVEHLYDHLMAYVVINGAVSLQTFFVISGFLLIYNFKLQEEKYQLRWIMLPKNILLRWLRFSVPLALILAVSLTWQGLAGSGPSWDKYVLQEVRDCQRSWWTHLLYINNYFQGVCHQQTWYLAADMQFFIIGSIIHFACKSTRSKVIALTILAAIGLVSPGIHTYFQDLDGAIIVSPTHSSKFYVDYLTLNVLHRMSHNNIFGYITGMSLGYTVYHYQQKQFNIQKYKKYRIMYWFVIPAVICVVLSGRYFYMDGPRSSMLVRILYGSLVKPTIAVLMAVSLFGMIFKFEGFYRSFFEWPGWVVPDRLGTAVFMFHLIFMKTVLGFRTTLTTVSILQVMVLSTFIVSCSYAIALVMYLLLERPYAEVYNLVSRSRPSKDKQKNI